jgi:thiol-disulfide isomerase/thioredoxin
MKQISTFLLLGLLAACYSAEPQKTGKEGSPMPAFKILLTDSITWLNTNALPMGQASVLFYFSPHCRFCKSQTTQIIENIDNLKKIHFYFISSYPIPALKTYSKEFELAKYPNIQVARDTTKEISDYFEIIGVPYLAIYGKDKKLNKSFLGGKLYSSQIKKIAEE